MLLASVAHTRCIYARSCPLARLPRILCLRAVTADWMPEFDVCFAALCVCVCMGKADLYQKVRTHATCVFLCAAGAPKANLQQETGWTTLWLLLRARSRGYKRGDGRPLWWWCSSICLCVCMYKKIDVVYVQLFKNNCYCSGATRECSAIYIKSYERRKGKSINTKRRLFFDHHRLRRRWYFSVDNKLYLVYWEVRRIWMTAEEDPRKRREHNWAIKIMNKNAPCPKHLPL